MADLIRNPNSSNEFYINPSYFPIFLRLGGSTEDFESTYLSLLDDGRMKITGSVYNKSSFYLDLGAVNLKKEDYYLVFSQNLYERLDAMNTTINFATTFGTTQALNINQDSTLLDGLVYIHLSIDSLTEYFTAAIMRLSFNNFYADAPTIQIGLVAKSEMGNGWESAYMEEKYTIIFHDPSGINADVIYQNCEAGISSPTPPSWNRAGYELVGWKPNIADTVTKDQTYVAQWATEGSDSLPITLKQLRQYSDGVGMNCAVTMRQDALLLGGDAGSSAQDVGDCVVTVAQFKELSKRLAPLSRGV